MFDRVLNVYKDNTAMKGRFGSVVAARCTTQQSGVRICLSRLKETRLALIQDVLLRLGIVTRMQGFLLAYEV
jgi:hypothetical protein